MSPKRNVFPPSNEPKIMKKANIAEKNRLAARERNKKLTMERFDREVAIGSRNATKFRQYWRNMIARVKMPTMKEDIEVAWRTFDRILDAKNYSIGLLLDEIDCAEEQYEVNQRGHIEAIDRLIATYKSRLEDVAKKYRNELEETLRTSFVENEEIGSQQMNDELYLRTIMFGMDEKRKKLMTEVDGRTVTKIKRMEADFENSRRIGKLVWERKTRDLWEEMLTVFDRYEADVASRRREYERVGDKDETARSIITRQVEKMGDLFESIRRMKEEIRNYEERAREEGEKIKAELQFFNNDLRQAKLRFESEQTKDQEQLRTLAVQFTATKRKLESILAKGQNLLTLVRICRKYETSYEKASLLESSSNAEERSIEWVNNSEIIGEFQNLELFWKRVGSVQLGVNESRLERDELKEESRCLRQCLEEYLAQC